ncbi:hypothetical protein [Dactylosporangium sp. NPDC050588]|uniref:hypothetical protein n=1 Tax=Dactylosporangium sp. NPDC050588 TaxID=3157211 RepID=UPI0033E0A5CC
MPEQQHLDLTESEDRDGEPSTESYVLQSRHYEVAGAPKLDLAAETPGPDAVVRHTGETVRTSFALTIWRHLSFRFNHHQTGASTGAGEFVVACVTVLGTAAVIVVASDWRQALIAVATAVPLAFLLIRRRSN